RDRGNVGEAIGSLGIDYPLAMDTDYGIWRAFENHYWPAHYFIDGQGRIRYHHFGEGEYARSEDVIRRLLAENGAQALPGGYVDNRRAGAQAPPSGDWKITPETYLGYARQKNFAGRTAPGAAAAYTAPSTLALHQWALHGQWKIEPQYAQVMEAGGAITLRFRARDLHLVLAPGEHGKPVRFRVTLDGQPPGADAGSDIDAAGNGTVTSARLYQLVRQRGGAAEPDRAPQYAQVMEAGGAITLRFRARDLHLVLAPGEHGKPVRFRVTLDGQPPGADAGSDIDAAGNGTVTSDRLYQLVRQRGGAAERVFEITFLDPGARAYAFTAG